MARKKQLVPHFVRGNAFDCENPFEFGKSGNWLEYTSKGRFVETANNQFLPPPLSGWQEKVFTADTRCNKLNLHRVEAIIKDYVAARVARAVNPIEWTSHIERIERIENLTKNLLEELNDWPEGYDLIWDRFTQISSIGVGRLIAHDDVYPVISNLYSAASAAVIQAKSDRAQGKELSHQEPWRALVGGLKAEWTGVGGKATAAKSGRGRYANPSEFVRLVWAIMRYAIPAELREHTASEGAMQTAVSEALRPRRCRDNSSKKPLRKNPAKR